MTREGDPRPPGESPRGGVVGRALSYLRPYRTQLLLASLASFAYAVFDAFSIVLLIPFLATVFGESAPATAKAEVEAPGQLERALEATLGRMVDLEGDPQAVVVAVIVLILALVILKNVADFARSLLSARIEQGMARDLRRALYDGLLEMDLAFFARARTGQVASRLTHDVEQLRTLATSELIRALSSVLIFTATLYWMLAISLRLTAAAFVVVPLTMVLWGPLVRRLRRGDARVLDLAGAVGARIHETVAGIREVKSASAEAFERNRFRELTGGYLRTLLRTERLRALAGPMTEALVALGTALLLWYGARLVVVERSLTGGEFVGFIFLSTRLYAPVKHLSKLPALLQPGLAAAERIFELLDAPVGIRDRQGAKPLRGVRKGISYRGVTMEYRPGEPVLRDIDLFVPVGSVAALVGPSGAGKSTVVDLLARFHEPTSGSIEIDGIDLRRLRVGSLRSSLGMVSQEAAIFHDTVHANIAYGTAGASREEVERAARAARAHHFVSRLPEGYDTQVGERGTVLSGGERQRLAIARALLRDPPILVLDEATSALDADSERLVQQALAMLMRGRTVIVIAHRLATIRRADRIFVLDGGRIVQEGTHESLLAEGGLYRRLAASG